MYCIHEKMTGYIGCIELNRSLSNVHVFTCIKVSYLISCRMDEPDSGIRILTSSTRILERLFNSAQTIFRSC